MNAKIDAMAVPFVKGIGLASELGAAIAHIYKQYDARPPLAAEVWNAAAQSAAIITSPFFKAGLNLARVLDAGVGTGIPNGYHNTKHYLEVLINAVQLILRNGDDVVLDNAAKGKLLFAALAHDFYYEPGGNGTEPYRLEYIAFMHAKPFLEDQGITSEDIADIGVMIYGTDASSASHASAFVRAAHRHLFENGPAPVMTDVLKRVRPILENPQLARLAALLGDADILSSAGLTYEMSVAQSKKLGLEWKKALGPKNALSFINTIAENRFATPAALFFQPNMDAIAEAARDQLIADPEAVY